MLNNVLTGTGNFIDGIDQFMTNNTIDVLYKALAVIGVLFAFYSIPVTRKFTVWAALCLLFILMIQSSPSGNNSTGAATSTLPMPTQINTPVPQQQSSQVASTGSSSSGGSSILGDIGSVLSIAALFA